MYAQLSLIEKKKNNKFYVIFWNVHIFLANNLKKQKKTYIGIPR